LRYFRPKPWIWYFRWCQYARTGTNTTYLLGFYDPFAQDFVPSETTSFINKARQAHEKDCSKGQDDQLYVLLLDEINLARVEYYFSNFLSKMQMIDASNDLIACMKKKKVVIPGG